MSWKKVGFRNFKSLKKIDIELSDINILAGGNAAGKSSIIQAILLAKNTAETWNTKEIKLNGPYNLMLGRAEDIISHNPISDEVAIIISNEEQDMVYRYNLDYLNRPYTIELNENSSGNIHHLNKYVVHYLNTERIGPRKGQMFDPSESLTTGFHGEYVNHVLSRADALHIRVPENIKNPNALERFSTQVEAWMQLVIPDFRLEVTPIKEVDMVTISYGNSALGRLIPPTSTGFGISYSLPIITAGLLATTQENSVLIVENPEAHLHPYSQSRIGQFLALVSLAGVQIIIETHSEHIINGMRIQLAKKKATQSGIVHYITQTAGDTISSKIEIKENGELSSWPKGFFDQEKNDLFELLRLKREGS
jgi:predicted ATPase